MDGLRFLPKGLKLTKNFEGLEFKRPAPDQPEGALRRNDLHQAPVLMVLAPEDCRLDLLLRRFWLVLVFPDEFFPNIWSRDQRVQVCHDF
ncbi:hypothetical protein R1flu_011344 [Riccia fluitans]|uniref:Uncharacterized protein n=1 Tax=Riccia fluitans TaxID=41844 RepID=A0ABD1ZBR2_9MARC